MLTAADLMVDLCYSTAIRRQSTYRRPGNRRSIQKEIQHCQWLKSPLCLQDEQLLLGERADQQGKCFLVSEDDTTGGVEEGGWSGGNWWRRREAGVELEKRLMCWSRALVYASDLSNDLSLIINLVSVLQLSSCCDRELNDQRSVHGDIS